MKKTKLISTAMATLVILSGSPSILISAQSASPTQVNQQNQLSIPTSGTCGTANWNLANGILVIHHGELAHTRVTTASTNISPWANISDQITKIIFDGKVVASPNSLGLFAGLPNLTEIDGLSNLDTTNVTNMAFMFADNPNLTKINDLASLNTNNVTNMAFMFARSSKLKTLDLSSFRTSKVIKMASMFADTSSLVNLDLSNFDTSNVTNMNGMFDGASSLVNLDLSNFDVSKVTDMNGMFGDMPNLKFLIINPNFPTSRIPQTVLVKKATPLSSSETPSSSSTKPEAQTPSSSSTKPESQTPSEVSYQTIYRIYNKNTGEHFYTTSIFEKDSIVKKGWTYEGIGWSAPKTGTAVYRVYNPNARGGDHYYTISQYEAQSLVKKGWKWDNESKPVFYSGGQTPVYTAFNPNATVSGSHNYTSSSFEQQTLLKNGWKFGKVQFYGK